MNLELKKHEYEFVIIGAGVAGAVAFFYLSKIAPTLLIEKKEKDTRFFSARILVGHAQQFLPEDIPLDNHEIFIRPVDTIGHSSRNLECVIEGTQEFNQPFGQVIDEQKFIHWFIERGAEQQGRAIWGTKVVSLERTGEIWGVKCHNSVGNSPTTIQAKMLIMATGAYGTDLQKYLGFKIPDQLRYLAATFFANQEGIQALGKADYIYHLHPKISTVGPLQMTRANNFFNIIYVDNLPYNEMEEKLLRILQNYEPIQPWFNSVTNKPANLTSQDFRHGLVWKHPIKEFVQNNVLLIGETTGLVTECYYEGLMGALATAKYAAHTLQELFVNKRAYTKECLSQYQAIVSSVLLKNFHKSQTGSENMFLTAGSHQIDIWDAYQKSIQKDKKVRRNIHLAWTDPDIANYPLVNDEYCGEQIYLSLPLGIRLLLTPYFLKLKFNS